MEEADLDLVVVGAGWFGLSAAKTYLTLFPTHRILVLDSAATVGGVWASERLYPGLRSNNLLGTYEYSDFPLDGVALGVRPGEHIPGSVVHAYLEAYARRFDVTERIRFRTTVIAAHWDAEDAEWSLSVENVGDAGTGDGDGCSTVVRATTTLRTRRLILATGLTSAPMLPSLSGAKTYGAPIVHIADLGSNAGILDNARRVTVLGGTKSGWDAAYWAAVTGVQVDMVVRKSGRGPCWMAPPYVTPAKRWLEKLVHTRLLTFFSPCAWGSADGYVRVRRFLNATIIGRTLLRGFWHILSSDVLSRTGYDSHPATTALKPWTPAFNVASGLSILNYPTDFFEFVRNGTIRVHVGDVSELSPQSVVLESGQILHSDALIACTGWKHRPQMRFSPPGIEALLGLPYTSRDPVLQSRLADTDRYILEAFPYLVSTTAAAAAHKSSDKLGNEYVPLHVSPQETDPTVTIDDKHTLTPYLLHRFMVPPAFAVSRSIGFAGALMSISTPLVAQTQALWLAAFFSGSLDLPDEHKMQRETLLHARFGRWRYPASAGVGVFPDFVFDALPYLDLLLTDLGMERYRKGGGIREVLEAYGPEDYRDLAGEWRRRSSH